MEPYDVFLRECVRIGEGMMSRVFSWNGFAHRCFGEGYPAEMISREY